MAPRWRRSPTGGDWLGMLDDLESGILCLAMRTHWTGGEIRGLTVGKLIRYLKLTKP